MTIRLSEREYEALSGLSVIEDETVSTIIRQAIAEHIKRVVSDKVGYDAKTRAAMERAEKARRDLLRSIGVDETGSIPRLA